MSIKPLFSTLVSVGSMLMLAGTAQAQGLFGGQFFAPYNSQPRYVSPQPVYVSPCGPNGCPTNVNYGYTPRSNCPGGVCSPPSYRYSTNYAPSYGMANGTCGPNGCSTGGCANGSCPPRCVNGQCFPRNGMQRALPYDYSYPTQTLPMPAAPSRDYLSNRPTYYYGDDLPTRSTPPAYLDPRVNPYYGASRSDRSDYANVNRSNATFDTNRSPFYP